MLSKIEITIDFNGPGSQTLSFKWWIFFKFHKVIPIIIIDNLNYGLFHSPKRVQQP